MKYLLACLGILFALVYASLLQAEKPGATGYNVGVYYFPGWGVPINGKNPPWDKIKSFPEREPLLGWYPEGEVSISERQLQWMSDYGINFVIYDWYWDNAGIRLNHAIDAYLRAGNRKTVKFAILWANHSEVPVSEAQFDQIVDYWISHYFRVDSYLLIDSKPAVFVFTPDRLDKNARGFGVTSKELIDRAKHRAIAAGLPGIYFVAVTQAVESQVTRILPQAGYSALTGYNYHFGLEGSSEQRNMSHTYQELSDGYQESWNWILANSPLPYFIPVTSGWDKRPLGGTLQDPEHDHSVSTPTSFADHLHRARALLDRYPDKTQHTVVICCWNEYGEGSYIEPTKLYRLQYLEQVRAAFKNQIK